MTKTLYKCDCCGEIFDEDELEYEIETNCSECWGSPAYEDYSVPVCPFCGSEDIDETYDDEEDEYEEDTMAGSY